MDELNNNYGQVYNVEEDITPAERVGTVICILMQRCLYIAGFDSNKELLTIHYTGYKADKAVWDTDFFEHLFSHEQLLKNKDKVRSIFIGTDKNLVVPEDLYEEPAAKNWLSHLHHVEKNDMAGTYALADEKAHYVYAAPVNITELVKINFKKAVIVPLPFYHFCGTGKQSLHLQCVISSEQVTATLHNYSQLLWHKVFSYTSAEDIAYQVKHLCMENNISPSKVTMVCNALSAAEFDVINDLTQYYPGIKAGDGSTINNRWVPAISLAKQLLACV
jgi:hypothetical protein